MTAEIAIMNKGAIALAADSAVTMERQGGAKIYNSVNKLFMLSKYQPVGVMVYGMANFCGVPWETIIKVYRSHLGEKQFPTLKEYVDDFLSFLVPQSKLFSKEDLERYVEQAIGAFYYYLFKKIDRKVRTLIEEKGSVTNTQVRRIASSVITNVWKLSRDIKKLPCFEKMTEAVIDKHKKVIGELKKQILGELPFTKNLEKKLRQLTANIFLKDQFKESYPETVIAGFGSGLVMAGFGENEHFPSLVLLDIDGFFEGQLRYIMRNHHKIDHNTTAAIMPFAQGEMVHTFMEGIDPVYHIVLQSCLNELFNKLPNEFVNALSNYVSKKKLDLTKKLKESCGKLFEDLKKRTDYYRKKNHVEPVTRIVEFLPKDELAAMAESLVNLTSFKRRMSMDAETVGGPIDVAVISKGDGFIWIKRKHYFDPKLNPAFFANYYRDAMEGE